MRRVILLISLAQLCSSFQIPFRSQSSHLTFTSSPSRSMKLFMSEEQNLLDQMRKALGESDDIFADTEKESKQLMQGTFNFNSYT